MEVPSRLKGDFFVTVPQTIGRRRLVVGLADGGLDVWGIEPRRQTPSRDRNGPPGYVTRRRFANWRVCVSWSVATRQFIHDIKHIPPRLYYIGEEGRGA
jgi:hypothetical protein